MIKIRRSHDRLIFIMGFPYLEIRYLYWSKVLGPILEVPSGAQSRLRYVLYNSHHSLALVVSGTTFSNTQSHQTEWDRGSSLGGIPEQYLLIDGQSPLWSVMFNISHHRMLWSSTGDDISTLTTTRQEDIWGNSSPRPVCLWAARAFLWREEFWSHHRTLWSPTVDKTSSQLLSWKPRVVMMSTLFSSVSGGTSGCQNDNLLCYQWQQNWHHQSQYPVRMQGPKDLEVITAVGFPMNMYVWRFKVLIN